MMVKKFMSMLLVCTMLAGLYIPALADTAAAKTYPSYGLDEASGTVGTMESYGATSKSWVSGDAIPEKLGDKVYKLTWGSKTDVGIKIPKKVDQYADGEKLHISTEFMVPSGLSIYDLYGPCVEVHLSADSALTSTSQTNIGARVNYPGNTRNGVRANDLVRFDAKTGYVNLFGNQVATNFEWERDTWYKVDCVIVMGANPKAAVYINGQPLTIGDDIHSTNNATFDGLKTSSDYVDIYLYSSNGNYSSCYAVNKIAIGMNGGAADATNELYFDNTFIKGMSATEEPEIDSGLAFKGIADGAVVDVDELSAVKVNVPAWISGRTAKIALSIDSASASESTQAPFTFDLSAIGNGIHNIVISAYDANNNLISEETRKLIVIESDAEERIAFEENFENSDPLGNNSELKSITSTSNISLGNRKLFFDNMTDSDGITHKAAVLYADSGASALKLGYKPTDGKVINDGVLNISYDMYIQNTDFAQLQFNRRNGYPFVIWDDATNKFKTKNAWMGVSGDYSFDAVTQKWHKWNWTIEYSEICKLWLTVDDKIVLDGITVNTIGIGARDQDNYLGFNIDFDSDYPSTIALDNMKVTHKLPSPYIKSVDFGEGNEQNGLVKTSADTISFALIGNGFKANEISEKLGVINVTTGSELADVTVTSAADTSGFNITLSDLNLETENTYKVVLAEGLPFDNTRRSTDGPLTFAFTAVDSFPVVSAPDDGVAGDITVSDVRFTVNSTPVSGDGLVKEYIGGALKKGQELRADVMVNNASAEEKTFTVIIATYCDNELVGISVGEKYTVSAGAVDRVVTSGKITIGDETDLKAKVMILGDLGVLAPLSKSFSIN